MSLMTQMKNALDIRKEMDRRKSQRLRVLMLLKRKKYVTTVDLQEIAFNYTMRVSELRKQGHIIKAEYVRPGVYHYIYKGQKAVA